MSGNRHLALLTALSLLAGMLVACGAAQSTVPPPLSTAAATSPTASSPPTLSPNTSSPRTAVPGTVTGTQLVPSPLIATAVRTSTAPPLGPFTLSPTQPASCFAAGFAEPEPKTYVEMLTAVHEYLYYRKRAFISGETQEFLARYPALQQGADPTSGVNDEARQIALYKKAFTLIDGDIDPEHYERIKVRHDGTSAEVIIHMLEIYLRQGYSITGSEVLLKLSLQQQSGTWTVVRTDALIDGERQCR